MAEGVGARRRRRLERAGDHGAQLAAIDRLGDVIVQAGGAEGRHLVGKHVGGHGDDRNAAAGGKGADHPRRRETVHAGHLHVHQHEVVAGRAHGRDRRLAASRHLDPVPVSFEQRAGEHLVHLDVLDDQEAAGPDRRFRRSRGRTRPVILPVWQRHREPEGGAATHLASQADLAAHQLDQFLADRKAQPRTAVAAGNGSIRLAETPEQPVLRRRLDARTRVADRYMKAHARPVARAHPRLKRDHAVTRELDGVVEQIEQNLLETPRIAHEAFGKVGIDLAGQSYLLGCRQALNQGDRIVEQGARGEGHLFDLDPAGLDPGHVQDVVDDGQQRGAGRSDDRGPLAQHAGEGGIVEHQAGEADDAVEGCADLVAHGGEEVAFRPARGQRLFARVLGFLPRYYRGPFRRPAGGDLNDCFLVGPAQVGFEARPRGEHGGELQRRQAGHRDETLENQNLLAQAAVDQQQRPHAGHRGRDRRRHRHRQSQHDAGKAELEVDQHQRGKDEEQKGVGALREDNGERRRHQKQAGARGAQALAAKQRGQRIRLEGDQHRGESDEADCMG